MSEKKEKRPFHKATILNISKSEFGSLVQGYRTTVLVPNDLVCTSRCGDCNEHFWERRFSLLKAAVKGNYRKVFTRFRAGAGSEKLSCFVTHFDYEQQEDQAYFRVELIKEGLQK